VPWVSTETNGNGGWRSRFKPAAEEDQEKIEV